MNVIIPTLLTRFSSEQGYVLFDDAMPTSTYLNLRSCDFRALDAPIPDAFLIFYLLSYLLPRRNNVSCGLELTSCLSTVNRLKELNVRTGLVSNTDSRMRE